MCIYADKVNLQIDLQLHNAIQIQKKNVLRFLYVRNLIL